MSEISEPGNTAPVPTGVWVALKKGVNRLQDWFTIQSAAVKLAGARCRDPDSGDGDLFLRAAAEAGSAGRAGQGHGRRRAGGEAAWTFNEKLPVVFGTGSRAELPGSQPGRSHHRDLQAADVERLRAHRPDRVAGQAIRLLPERHGDQDLRGQGRHRALGRQAGVRAARRARQRQRRTCWTGWTSASPALGPQSEKDGWKAGVSGAAVGGADARAAGLPVLPAQAASSSRSNSSSRSQVHGSHRRPGGHGRHQGRSGADQGPVPAPRRVRRVRHRQAVQRDVQRPRRHRQDQARELPGQGAEPADPVPFGRQPGNRLRGAAARTRSAASWPWPSAASAASCSSTRRRTCS